jgi:hypothetical protein
MANNLFKTTIIMLKNMLSILVLAVAYWLVPMFLPWWSVAIPATIFGFLAKNNLRAFSIAFLVLALVWGVQAQMQNAANAGLLAAKMGTLLGGLGAIQMVLVAAVLGGLIGGIFGLSGQALKKALG